MQTSDARQANRSAVLSTVLRGGPKTRQEIARLTQLSKATVSRLVRELLEDGLLSVEAKVSGPDVGRARELLRFRGQFGTVCGIDMGGATTRFVLSNYGSQFLAAWRAPTPCHATARQLADWIAAEITSHVSVARLPEPTVTVLAVSGVVDPQGGTIRSSKYLHSIEGRSFIDRLAARLTGGLRLENDSNAALVSELLVGAAAGLSSAVMVTIGTGIGAGVALDGTLLTGRHGLVGEVGLLPVDLDGSTFEDIVTGPAITESARAVIGTAASPAEVLLAPEESPLGALRAKILAATFSACVAVTVMYEPDVIIFGGGVTQTLRHLLPELQIRLDQLVEPAPRLVHSSLGDAAGVIGATALALETAHGLLGAEGGNLRDTLESQELQQLADQVVSSVSGQDNSPAGTEDATYSIDAM